MRVKTTLVKSSSIETDGRITQPKDVAVVLSKILAAEPPNTAEQEHIWVLILGSKLQIKEIHLVHLGTWEECQVSIPVLLRAVLVAGSERFILAHNHPSGSIYPSDGDHDLIKRTRKAAETVCLCRLDALIVSATGEYWSAKEVDLL